MRAINFPCMNDAKLGNIQNCTENKSDEDCQSWIKFVEIVQLLNQTSVNLRANFAYLSTREAAFQIVTGIQIHQSQAELSSAWKALYSNANQQQLLSTFALVWKWRHVMYPGCDDVTDQLVVCPVWKQRKFSLPLISFLWVNIHHAAVFAVIRIWHES